MSNLKPFDPYDWWKIGDLERNPHVMFSQENMEWNKIDKQRMMLIALDRYADYLTTHRRRRYHRIGAIEEVKGY